jgi:hypothetical protein
MVDAREQLERFARMRPRRRSTRPTRRLKSGTISLLGVGGAATALGAGLMYLLDPQLGRRRRHLAQDRSAAALRRARRRFGRLARRARAETDGLVQRARHLNHLNEPAPNDEALADRVRSEIFRDLDRHGRINVNVEDGVVVLRGQLDRSEQIESLAAAARRVPGVRDVHSYLHLPDTPAPNKETAYTAGQDIVVPNPPLTRPAEQPSS